MSKTKLDVAEQPSWVSEPPSGVLPDPPIATRQQRLPLGALGWEDFERLCLRLAEIDGEPEHFQIFGTAGQEQGGIDILVRHAGDGRYVVWQSKRYAKMTPARLRNAVDRFLVGDWADRSSRFVFATSADMTPTELALAIEEQASRLAEKNVILDVRDVVKLSKTLKDHPRIVDDFFDRPWTEKFCGAAAVQSLEDHLPRGDYSRLKQSLLNVYEAHFAAVDPGVLRASSAILGPPTAVPLRVRYVPHDLLAPAESTPEPRGGRPPEPEGQEGLEGERRTRSGSPDPASVRERQRIPLERWAGSSSASIVLGPPGAGKSTLLRYLALDLLSRTPRLHSMRDAWGGRLPVWVSFPYWTRLIESALPPADISLEAAASAWLTAQGRPEIVGLIRRALRSGRAVLLVDGVDEWSGETAADTALGLLNAYVASQDLPAIVTSRPHGGRLLGSLDARWGRYELAGLTSPQQIEFASAWLEAPIADAGSSLSDPRPFARARAERIVADIGRSAEIASLATVPLMLGGLLALALEGAGLPRNRYAAYRELTARLLESHPRARGKAALAQSSNGDLDIPMRRRILGALAFHIQEGDRADGGLDAISTEAAIRFCADRMAEYLGVSDADAAAGARRLMAVGEESLGILVEKSPSTVGFLHRAFQEFLAASHLNARDLAAQCELFQRRAGDAQWRDVLLFTAQAATRESDVERIVEAIDACADPAIDGSRELLLCDIAFSEVVRSSALTRRLAERFFAAVEARPSEALRVELLQGVIAGLGSEQTAVLVRPRLSLWFPKWTDWNHLDAIRLIADWSEPDVDDVLWRCIYDDRLEHAVMAASGLARRHRGDEAWRQRFVDLARDATRATAVAASVAGLVVGWPDHDRTNEVVDRAAGSQSRIIVLAGIEGRITLGRPEDADRDRLVDWMLGEDIAYDGAIPALLARGWRDWAGLRETLLTDRHRWSRDPALTVAITTFGGDDEVARVLVELLSRQKGYFAFHSHWREIRQHFAGHPILTLALEADLANVEDDFGLANGAYIARSEPFKAKLLSRQLERSYLDFWIVDALLDLWPDDPEVGAALQKLVEWDDDQLAEIAHRLPQIIKDPGECRARLIRLLKTRTGGRHGRADRILKGLAATGGIADDSEILEAALKVDRVSDYFWAGMNTAAIIEVFADLPEVQDLATQALRTAAGLTGVVALCQGHLSLMRAEVLKVSAPLPDALRMAAVEALRERAVDDDYAMDLLRQAQTENEEDVCTAALIAVAESRQSRADIDDTYVAFLSRELMATGNRMAGRRLGAVAALGVIGRGDLVQTARESKDSWEVHYLYSWRDYGAAFAALAAAWPALSDALGDTSVNTALGIDDETFLAQMAPRLTASQPGREAVAATVDRQLGLAHPRPTALSLRARERVGRSALKTVCLDLLARGGGSWNEIESVFMAVRILAEEFNDDPAVLQNIEALSRDLGSFGAIAALSDGWPDSQAFADVFSQLVTLGREVGAELSMTAVVMKVTMAGSRPERVVRALRDAANTLTGAIWDGLPYWLPSAVRRLQREPAIAGELMAVLDGEPTAGEILTLVSLQAAAYGVTPDLRRWIEAAISRLRLEPIASTGMDLWRSRPDTQVRQRLVEVLRDGV